MNYYTDYHFPKIHDGHIKYRKQKPKLKRTGKKARWSKAEKVKSAERRQWLSSLSEEDRKKYT